MEKKTKYIFVTGGVISGLGKGVSAASIGRMLKSRGYNVFVQKFDPYLNIDPGTMDPYEHGEVFVTSDGGETDLDLGYYERFIGEKFNKNSSYSQGKILSEVLAEERSGKYQGQTIQVVPHVTNKIIEKMSIIEANNPDIDFVITEIGGTVGDIESEPFMYSISEFIRKKPSFMIHTVYLPYLTESEEFKTKPTQFSIQKLNSHGIKQNLILLRSSKSIHDNLLNKISAKTLTDIKSVIPVPTVDSIYKLPVYFEKYNIAEQIEDHFGLEHKVNNNEDWLDYISKIDAPKEHNLKIAMVGKYIEYEDSYKSLIEAIKNSSIYNGAEIELEWIQSDKLNDDNIEEKLSGKDGVIILPGFGQRGFDGKVVTSEYTWKMDIPTLGICFGFQSMTVAQARRMGITDATSSEVSKKGTPVIDVIEGKEDGDIGGILRLGEYTADLKDGSIIKEIYGSSTAVERHRHRYEVNSDYIEKMETEDFYFSGYDQETGLAEYLEDKSKKYYIGLQSHPEFSSSPLNNHPIFDSFVKALIKNK